MASNELFKKNSQDPPFSIVLQDVRVSFDDEVILDRVSLSVKKGERLVLIGPSGQGKTVLMKTLAGLITPTQGTLLIEGQPFHQLKSHQQQDLLLKMGMLFQKNALFDSLTVEENIAFPIREMHIREKNKKASPSFIDSKVEHFLSSVGLSHTKGLFPDEISGGMQKRVGIARAIALDPEIIFYDDPTAGLDPITSKKIIELIILLQKKRSSTLVAITNDMNRAYQLADRIAIVLDKGVLMLGSVQETLQHPDPRVQQFIRGWTHGPLTEME